MSDLYNLPPERELPSRRYAAARRQLAEAPSLGRWAFMGRWRHTGPVIGLGIGVAVGGGVAWANGVFTQPGAPSDTPLAAPVNATHTGTATVELGPPPRGTNEVTLTLTGLSEASYQFPDGSYLSCSASDISRSATDPCRAIEVVPINSGQHTATITTGPTARWHLEAVYIKRVITPLGVNANGQTYGAGVPFGQGAPDLIAVSFDHGRTGYVKATDLDCASGSDVSSPSEALARQNALHGDGVSIPVYESDGTTKIGTFVVGAPGSPVVPLSQVPCGGPDRPFPMGPTRGAGKTVAVPEVVGKSQAQAITVLTAEGLAFDVRFTSSNQSTGDVITQDPAPGSRVSSGTRVELIVSSGQ